MLLNKQLIHYNYSSRNGTRIAYIVVHDTGNPDRGADAMAHYRYFSGGNRRASVHYFVDDKGVVQIIEDAYAAWHCGDGHGAHGITNRNSIGVEICINQGIDRKAALAHARNLVKELMAFYRIPKDHVVRHFDASRKICPHSMAKNNWAEWWGFWESL
ncbi:peptidoglycan recognition protein family protein [Aedoeadaptatus acetigenes]|uniref:peptidoglycan recognition protein family protein n=1 Tax=Aedoeadaptatus acetigenes TaxID=2981723 RepID=UPI0011DCD9B3|nr:N-acetylmuramoyl-L-alanine amidase [Aedoeadaptatus acetigenes]MCU6787461.1 N-acetylmuramoyl-L-alanine amidase [Aedoeadaptatus acetigenes]